MSHSQFHCTARVYLDMHGLIFETSICYWQDQLSMVRLLPSLDVVAVSQAPSPESNPDSPLPVVTMVGTDSTIES